MNLIGEMQKTMETINQNQRAFQTQGSQNSSSSPTNDLTSKISDLRDALFEQKSRFDRFVQISQNRIASLEKEVSEFKTQLDKATESLSKIKDKEVVERSREALFSRRDALPLDKPVDRNGVAPSKVQIADIFNCSGKRF